MTIPMPPGYQYTQAPAPALAPLPAQAPAPMAPPPSSIWNGMASVETPGTRHPQLKGGRHVVQVKEAFIMMTRSHGLAAIIEGVIVATNSDMPVGSSFSIYLSAKDQDVFKSNAKAFVTAVLGGNVQSWGAFLQQQGLDISTDQGLGVLMDLMLPAKESQRKSAAVDWKLLVQCTPATSRRTKQLFLRRDFESWSGERESREGLPVFDPTRPPPDLPAGYNAQSAAPAPGYPPAPAPAQYAPPTAPPQYAPPGYPPAPPGYGYPQR